MGYFREAARGVSWVGAFRVVTRFVAFGRTIVLARILSPARFGVFGIATLLITFLEIVTETGINVFLIQKREYTKSYLNTAWVVSILRGVLITAILLLLASPISTFFNSPDSRVAIYLVSLVSLIRGFINPSIVQFQKELKFRAEFWFRFIIFAFDSGVAIMVSLLTGSELGIIIGLIAGAILELIMSFVFVTPWPKLAFNKPKATEIISKGKWLTGAGIFQFLFRQGDDAVVGKILGESSLGFYQMAYKISSLPISEATDVVARVNLPIYVKISGDKQRLKKAFLKSTFAISFVALVLGLGLYLFGEFIVLTLLGSQWAPIVPLVKILSIFGIIQAISNSAHTLLLALERQKYVTGITLVNILGLGLTIIPLTRQYGLLGAAIAPLIGSILGLPIMLWFVFKSLK